MNIPVGKFSLSRILLSIVLLLLLASSTGLGAIIADHNSVEEFSSIPLSMIETIRANYRIHYVHTSHGSQIITGLVMLENEDGNYVRPPFHEPGDDLGSSGDTSWAPATRTYLDTHPDCNMAMFSWCGGVSWATEYGINVYLAKMEELEADYPNVIFIYMTGHLDGNGPTGNLYVRNNQIRDYCNSHDKILFDFADIESYNPDGTYFPDESDACNWCSDWCSSHDCPTCGNCEHSHCFNCYIKGKAWWWMMATIEGWLSLGIDQDDQNDLPDSYNLLQNYPNPFNMGTCIQFSLPHTTDVTIDIYNITGQKVRGLINKRISSGFQSVHWDGRDDNGHIVSSGVYLYRIVTDDYQHSSKMLLLK